MLLISGAAAMIYTIPKLAFSVDQELINYRALWDAKQIANYQIDILTVALPAPFVEWKLTIQGEQITQQSLVACNPVNPTSDCDTIRKYYSWMGKYTIAQLFDLANERIVGTQMSLLKCSLLTGNTFQAFTTFDALWSAAQTCQSYLQGSGALSAVQYDADYGYPKLITSYIPDALDSAVTIEVKRFQII